jgi:hypothetical protein
VVAQDEPPDFHTEKPGSTDARVRNERVALLWYQVKSKNASVISSLTASFFRPLRLW